MTKKMVYLDHNASAPLLSEAREAIMSALGLEGNPSSVHGAGRALRAVIETARDEVRRVSGAERSQVVFTGSATEAITQALVGGVKALRVDEIITSAADHAAVLRAAETSGAKVTLLPVSVEGVVDLEALEKALADADTRECLALVALHWVNNETGVVQPLEQIERRVGPSRHLLFVDAVQAFGKRKLDFAARATDMMAISAHKIGGPSGVGALLMKPHCDAVKLIPGGGQESGRRGGTESAALIAGFGAAAAHFARYYDAANIAELVARIETELRKTHFDLVVFGGTTERVGNVLNFAVPRANAATLMMGLDLEGIAVSSGSACSSGKVGRSHVLAAMNIAPELAECALRISVGWSSTPEDVDAFISGFSKVTGRMLKAQGTAA